MRCYTPSSAGRSGLLLCLLLALTACATRAAPVASHDPRLTLARGPLRLLHAGQIECALAADGTISLGDRPWARVEGDRVVSTDGRELVRVDGSSLHFAGTTSTATLTREGAIVGANGERMTLDDEGHPVFTSPLRAGPAVLHGTRVEGVTAATRPTAVVILGLLMFRMREQRADAPESP